MDESVMVWKFGDDPDDVVRILVIKEGDQYSVHFEIATTGATSLKAYFQTEAEAVDHLLFLSDQFAYTRIDS